MKRNIWAVGTEDWDTGLLDEAHYFDTLELAEQYRSDYLNVMGDELKIHAEEVHYDPIPYQTWYVTPVVYLENLERLDMRQTFAKHLWGDDVRDSQEAFVRSDMGINRIEIWASTREKSREDAQRIGEERWGDRLREAHEGRVQASFRQFLGMNQDFAP